MSTHPEHADTSAAQGDEPLALSADGSHDGSDDGSEDDTSAVLAWGVVPAVGEEIPVLVREPDEVALFMFSAAAWLIHRVHYDHPFTTGHDNHAGLLVHGPLQGAWMLQAVTDWLGSGVRPRSVRYRHLAPAYAGETIECGGKVTVSSPNEGYFEANLWVRKADGTVTTTGHGAFLIGTD